jgi:hypothetical protein
MGAEPALAIMLLHCSPHCLPHTRESTKKKKGKRKKCCYEKVLAKYIENCQESVNQKIISMSSCLVFFAKRPFYLLKINPQSGEGCNVFTKPLELHLNQPTV